MNTRWTHGLGGEIVLLDSWVEQSVWQAPPLKQRVFNCQSAKTGRHRAWRTTMWAVTPTRLLFRKASSQSQRPRGVLDIARDVTAATVVPGGIHGAPHVLHIATVDGLHDQYLAFPSADAALEWEEEIKAVKFRLAGTSATPIEQQPTSHERSLSRHQLLIEAE